MGLALTIGGPSALTAHEAFGVAMLLGAIGDESSLALSTRIQEQALADPATREAIDLTEGEQAALLTALRDLRQDLVPHHLIVLENLLEAQLGCVRDDSRAR